MSWWWTVIRYKFILHAIIMTGAIPVFEADL
jgi:hypothetical protein